MGSTIDVDATFLKFELIHGFDASSHATRSKGAVHANLRTRCGFAYPPQQRDWDDCDAECTAGSP